MAKKTKKKTAGKRGVPGKKKPATEKPKAVRTDDQATADKLVDVAVASIEKDFGKGSVMRLTDRMMLPKGQLVPSGSLGLDIALGGGGYVRGRVMEIFGAESSGKTTLSLTAIAQAQKLGLNCAFIDAEHALDPDYAEALGVNLSELLISQPDYGEQALAIADRFSRGGVGVIVVDSVAALTPKVELEGEMGDIHVGLQARLMSQAMRKLTATVSKSETLVIFINQTRMKIGVMFGNPETTSGGQALKFYASYRLDIRRIGPVKKGDKIIGNRTRVKVVKNKVAPPFKSTEFDLVYGKGISYAGEVLDVAVEHGVIEKSGAWFSYGKDRIGQGRDNACAFLAAAPEIMEEIRKKVLE
jgi:recombination protein RecA